MEIKRINLIPISVANFKYTPYKAQDKNLSSDSFPGHSSQIDKVNRIWYHIPYQILIAHTKVNSTLALIIFDISITSGHTSWSDGIWSSTLAGTLQEQSKSANSQHAITTIAYQFFSSIELDRALLSQKSCRKKS